MISFIKHRPLVAFFAFTYFFLLLGWLTLKGQIPFGPLLAALIVVSIVGGREGRRVWASRITRWRVDGRWYAAAILLPLVVTALAAFLNILLGAESSGINIDEWPDLIAEAIFIFLFVGLGEEPGFRGFALPRLQAHHSAVVATLILSVLGVIWHIPLFLSGDSPWTNVPLIVVGYFVFTWLFNNTNGSVLIPMLFHTATAVYGPLIFAPMFEGTDLTSYTWLLTALYGIVVAVVMVTSGTAHLSAKSVDELVNISEPTPVPAPLS
ncbi:MAG: CPBP family intramembrane metalloprotease [Chloroflexi bacterium]|nr:CPBP family intramembrane metalloprotease [Chloroflexota bacterium]